jgi:glyoxylate/hydroxypyruvate reductase A
MEASAKVFTNGNSQAVRLPKPFRLETSEVWISRDAQTGDIILRPKPSEAERQAQLAEFLASTRVLVNLLPLTPQTENLLNKTTLSQLQRGAYLINIARGRHVVDEDLLALLESGHLAGAALDVFRTEPLPAQHPYWRHPRVTVTPHIAGRTVLQDTVQQIASKIQALQIGKPIEGVVDRARGY